MGRVCEKRTQYMFGCMHLFVPTNEALQLIPVVDYINIHGRVQDCRTSVAYTRFFAVSNVLVLDSSNSVVHSPT